MLFKCSKCNNIFRGCNAEKHITHCKTDAVECCDCGKSLTLEEVRNHKQCPNAVRSKIPPLYNPKAKIYNTNITNLLIVDRAAYDNKEEDMAPIFEKLVVVDCIPKKKESFIRYTTSLCKVDENIAERVWNALEITRTKYAKEKRLAIERAKPDIRKEKVNKKESSLPKRSISKSVNPLITRIQRLISLHRNSLEGEKLQNKVVSLICERNPLEDKERVINLYNSILNEGVLHVCVISFSRGNMHT